MKTLVIIGAGGHGRVVADCAQQLNNYSEILFLDDGFETSKHSGDWEVAGFVKDYSLYIDNSDFIVALGSNALREKILEQLKNSNANIATLIHPSAVISPNTFMGKGVVVCANAVINIGSHIADGCIINTGSTIDHDCNVQQYSHISPGVNIAGGVNVGPLSWLGIGSTVIECITIAENTQVGAGAVITQSTIPNSLYLGVPAKRIRALKTT
jgi:sugar O-acyltransferase (sialic acid O-acetyltransferase NeuD family)